MNTMRSRNIILNSVGSDTPDLRITFSSTVEANRSIAIIEQKENAFLNLHRLDTIKSNIRKHIQNNGLNKENWKLLNSLK